MAAAHAEATQPAPKSLEALLEVHNAEIYVLRQLEKWIENRAQIDRQYAEALAKNAALLRNIQPNLKATKDGQKPAKSAKITGHPDWRDLPAVKMCDLIASYTESVSNAVRENAEELRHLVRGKMEALLEEKLKFDDTCESKRSMVLFELHRAQQETLKQRNEYARIVQRTAESQARYEALVVEQRASKLREAKEQYFRDVAHLHLQHNRYYVALRTANMFADDFASALLPNLANFGEESLESLMLSSQCVAERIAGGFERRAAHLVTAATQLRSQLNFLLTRDPFGTPTDSPTHSDVNAGANLYSAYLTRKCTQMASIDMPKQQSFDTSLLNVVGSTSGLRADELSINELIRDRFSQSHHHLLDRVSNTMKDIELRQRDRVAYERECANLADRLRRSGAECVSSPDDTTFQTYFDEKLMLYSKQRKLMCTNHELALLHVRLRRDRAISEAFETVATRLNGGAGIYPPVLAPFSAELNEEMIRIELANFDEYDDQEDELLGGLRRRLTGLKSRFRLNRHPHHHPVAGAASARPLPNSSSAYAAANITTSTSYDFELAISIASTPDGAEAQRPSSPTPAGAGAGAGNTSRVEVMEIDEDSVIVRRSKIDAPARSHTSAPQHAPPPPPPPPSSAEQHSALARSNPSKPNPYTDNVKVSETVARTSASAARLTEEQLAALSDEEWFHGVLPREEVQRLLVADGDYLLRESRNKQTGEAQLVLSVQWRGHKHFIVQGAPGAWKFESTAYPTVRELIEAQQRSSAPVTAKSGTILRHAILRAGWQIKNDDVVLETRIGQGNFGEVYKGRYKGRVVAVKKCKETMDGDAMSKFLQEGTILRNYDHPNIVKLIGIAAQRNPIMIVMEFVEGGSLLAYLKANRNRLTTIQLVRMCVDAAAGMTYLETKSCIHRDLAARNCLIGHDLSVKIADFGMSREEEVYEVSDGLKQIPIKWTAPEALNLAKYTSKCDVWSYGILMWEIFAGGATPYPTMTNQVAREQIERGYRLPAPEGTPEPIYAIMRRCWLSNPTERPTFRILLTELRVLEKQIAPPGVAVSVSVTDLLALQAQSGLSTSYGSFSLAHNGDDIQVNDEDI